VSEDLDLPDVIEPGEISFTFDYAPEGEEPTLFDFRATWGGGSTMTWWQDISESQNGLSPASSSPVEGWASWRNGTDLLIAYTWPDSEVDGFVHVPGGAPTNDKDDPEAAMSEPQTWVELARTILAGVNGELSGVEHQTYK
jgi:hypothetical protein